MDQKRTLADWITPPAAFVIMYTVIAFIRDVAISSGVLLAAAATIALVSFGTLRIARNYRSQTLAILCLAAWVAGIAAGILQN